MTRTQKQSELSVSMTTNFVCYTKIIKILDGYIRRVNKEKYEFRCSRYYSNHSNALIGYAGAVASHF